VVGVTFCEGYPGNLHNLRDVVEARYTKDGDRWSAIEDWEDGELVGDALPARLLRNPANEYDENAIEVHVPILGRHGTMIGHVDRHLAARLAPRMDSGMEFNAVVKAVYVHPDNPDNPGIDIRLTRVAASAAA
jgi:hypothetical protein